jgi:hypothetical protein
LITTQKIIDTVNQLLVNQYPTFTVYIQKVPEGFERPSFFIQQVTEDSSDFSVSLTNENLILQLVYFAPVSDYYIEDELNQLTVHGMLKIIFNKGFINVEDRAIKIKNNQGFTRDNEAYRTLEFDYIEGRPTDSDITGIPPASVPNMDNIVLNLNQGVD